MERGKSTGQYQPKRHDSSKQMWRDFASIVEQNDTKRLFIIFGVLLRARR